MYKTVKINLGRDLGFDEEFADIWAKVVPVVYLPLEVQDTISEMFAKTGELQAAITDGTAPTPEAIAASREVTSNLVALISDVVIDWNLVDLTGAALPVPSKMPEADRVTTVRKNVPIAILNYIVQRIMEDTGTIPPPIASESQTPSTKPSIVMIPTPVDSLAITHQEETPLTS